MARDPVQYIDGVPHWFTYALHRWSKYRYCRRVGHVRDPLPFRDVCGICGEIVSSNRHERKGPP
jgi:hypothetical protein